MRKRLGGGLGGGGGGARTLGEAMKRFRAASPAAGRTSKT